jgi:hypothetical protein
MEMSPHTSRRALLKFLVVAGPVGAVLACTGAPAAPASAPTAHTPPQH